MRFLTNPILIFLLFLGTSAVTSAQSMDFEWSQHGQYFGVSTPQPGLVVFYERQGQEWQVTGQSSYETHLPKPQHWSYLDGAIYGVSTDLDIGYLFSYSWKEEYHSPSASFTQKSPRWPPVQMASGAWNKINSVSKPPKPRPVWTLRPIKHCTTTFRQT